MPGRFPHCRHQPPVPAGDDCSAKALAFWFSDRVLHPKPSPKPKKPAKQVTLADMPAACKTVLDAPAKHTDLSPPVIGGMLLRTAVIPGGGASALDCRAWPATSTSCANWKKRCSGSRAGPSTTPITCARTSDGLKVGGHQASSASLATIMTALYFDVLKPADRVAVKPHASPIFHAIQYLLGKQTRERLEHFRGYKGAQSYPSRTKDADDVDFSTGSVGLGVAQTLFSSLVQDYVRAHGWGLERPEGRMVALVGDAELDEGNIFEAILEGWKQGLRNCWWIVDYNRQSLDAVVREGLWQRFEELFRDLRLAGRHPQIRHAAGSRVPRAGRRSLARLDRQVPEPALFGAGVRRRRGLAQAARRRDLRPATTRCAN